MHALEVHLNGKKLCVAGVGDDGVLSAIVSCVIREGKTEICLDTGGLDGAGEEHVRWTECKVRLGDKIQVRIVEATKVDKPKSRRRMQISRSEQLKWEKRYVRSLAKKLGWKIQARPPR